MFTRSLQVDDIPYVVYNLETGGPRPRALLDEKYKAVQFRVRFTPHFFFFFFFFWCKFFEWNATGEWLRGCFMERFRCCLPSDLKLPKLTGIQRTQRKLSCQTCCGVIIPCEKSPRLLLCRVVPRRADWHLWERTKCCRWEGIWGNNTSTACTSANHLIPKKCR